MIEPLKAHSSQTTETAYHPPSLQGAYTAPFSSEEYKRRFRAVRKKMQKRGLDALLVTSPENIFYLIGLNHQGHFAFTMLIFPLEGEPVLVTRAMEQVTVASQAPHVRHVVFGDNQRPATAIVRAMRTLRLTSSRVGVETNTMYFPIRIWSEIERRLTGVSWWEDSIGTVDAIRFIKSPAEIEYMRRSASINDAAVMRGFDVAGEGVNELEVAAKIYETMILKGSEFPGFAPLIRSMETLLQEHVTWRDNILEKGDDLFMEFSSSVYRYHAPLTRMLYIKEAPRGARESCKAVLEGLETIRENLRPGVCAGDVYAAWQKDVRVFLGDEHYRRHHCGYTVGIGFPPSWSGGSTVVGIRPKSKIRIKKGMVFHLLPWIFGTKATDYAISDTVLVTEDGAEYLTNAPREFLIK